jgi:hypothetical protein
MKIIAEPLRSQIAAMYLNRADFEREEKDTADAFERSPVKSTEMWIRPRQNNLNRYMYVVVFRSDFVDEYAEKQKA